MPGRNQKRISAKQVKHRVGSSSHSSKDDDVDIKTPMFPLDHYLANRSELLDQIFSSVSKGSHLDVKLPDILKDLPTEELKRLCLGQLEVMSKKRIRKILAGEEMESSSGTEDSDENEAASKSIDADSDTKVGVDAMDACLQPADSTSLEQPHSPKESARLSVGCGDGSGVIDAAGTSTTDMQISGDDGPPPSWSAASNSDVMLELHPDSVYGSPDDHPPRSNSMVDDDGDDDTDQSPEMEVEQPEAEPVHAETASDDGSGNAGAAGVSGDPSTSIRRTCMELFELELRARAIKSLLKTQSSVLATDDKPDDKPNVL